MREDVRRAYGGLCVISRGGAYELHEDGTLLARATTPDMADKLFFRRALDIAGERVAAGERAQVALTAEGKRRLCGEKEESLHRRSAVPLPWNFAQANVRQGEADGNVREVKPFRKPTVEEVAAYIEEKGYISDAAAFWNYHESTGWMVGRKKMRDWKSACRVWEGKEKDRAAREAARQKVIKPYVAVANPQESSLVFDEEYEAALRHYRPRFVPAG